jgi:hypothetical protein
LPIFYQYINAHYPARQQPKGYAPEVNPLLDLKLDGGIFHRAAVKPGKMLF